MASSGPEESVRDGGEPEEHCFLCWRSGGQNPLEPVFKSHPLHGRLSSSLGASGPADNSQLKSQLSVVFLLRKVLGIPGDVLTGLLEGTGGGNPSEWGIKLCGSCHLMWREAEFLHKRLVKIQAEFQDLAKEMREVLKISMEEQEVISGGTSLEGMTRMVGSVGKRLRRPPGTRDVEEDKGSSGSPVGILRKKAFEMRKNGETAPELDPPTVPLRTHRTPATNHDLCTPQPLMSTAPITPTPPNDQTSRFVIRTQSPHHSGRKTGPQEENPVPPELPATNHEKTEDEDGGDSLMDSTPFFKQEAILISGDMEEEHFNLDGGIPRILESRDPLDMPPPDTQWFPPDGVINGEPADKTELEAGGGTSTFHLSGHQGVAIPSMRQKMVKKVQKSAGGKGRRGNFTCLTCGKMFTNYSAFGRHKNSHTHTYNCKVCDKAFSRVDIRTRHEKQIHNL